MERISAHAEKKEPLLEYILGSLRYRKIIQHIPRKSKVLDLGCGYHGNFLLRIKKVISSGTGIDLSIDSNFSDEKIALLAHDLNQNLPVGSNSFDVVVSLANLEHLNDPENTLREINRVLKPGGSLLLTTPSIYGKPVLEALAFFGLVSRQEIDDHKRYFTKKILTDYCSDIGFSSIEHRYFQLGMNNFLMARK